MRNDSAKELIAEMEQQGIHQIPCISAQRGIGTYVVKELVYAYAMWISPAFHLKVIRTFDKLQPQGVAVVDHAVEGLLKNPMTYIEALMGRARRKPTS